MPVLKGNIVSPKWTLAPGHHGQRGCSLASSAHEIVYAVGSHSMETPKSSKTGSAKTASTLSVDSLPQLNVESEDVGEVSRLASLVNASLRADLFEVIVVRAPSNWRGFVNTVRVDAMNAWTACCLMFFIHINRSPPPDPKASRSRCDHLHLFSIQPQSFASIHQLRQRYNW